jgi:hypothetical protein
MLTMLPSSVAMREPSETLVRMSHLRSTGRPVRRSGRPVDAPAGLMPA